MIIFSNQNWGEGLISSPFFNFFSIAMNISLTTGDYGNIRSYKIKFKGENKPMNDMFDKITKHPTYGMLQFSRTTNGQAKNLYGSSIKHSHTIRLRIHEGEKSRHLNRDWYYARECLVEVEMSQAQFAEAITSMNMGSGVPVTLRYVDGVDRGECPEENKRQEIDREFEKDCKVLGERINKLSQDAYELLKSKQPLKRADRDMILNAIEMIRMEVNSNLPFVQQSFNESMDQTVLQGKGEIEAFFVTAIHQAGLEKLQEMGSKPEMIGYDKETEDGPYSDY